ncbi:LacI family transcriptional regulator [Cetobacterium somerae]|uniref:LacI family DNA-binding transcriptional regulator n=1 Tax=Cetobacterium sp. NK01 TaxID=2993530 RepID=UPI0021163AAD|nr:LacI family DNA-binding transcriptional regulator [Cetobacterium sp. NK01]MCQ8213205.1 LacI family transcriptional regulator [Cetobacterium sp. NK01]
MKINSTKVAQLAGVSRSTVSRVINNYSNVPLETKEKVLKVINELGYIPNSSAQVLAGKKSRTIGLFIYGDNNDKSKILDNGLSFGYYLDFINRVLKEALKLDYQLLVDVVNDDSFSKVESLYVNRDIVGGVFIGFKEGEENIQRIIKTYSPIVLVDYLSDPKCQKKDVYYINTEDCEGAKKATEHLINLGRKKIIHISGDKNKLSGKEREKGYVKAMESYGIAPMIYNGNYSDEKAVEIVKELLEKNIEFDGVFCANDNMSYCVNNILKEKGVENIPIVGFDNLRNTIPLGIMSVAPDINSLAKTAVELLVNDEKEKSKVTFVKTTLIKGLDEYIKESYLD